MKFICTLCNYVLEEKEGYPQAQIAPDTNLEQLPEDWKCPECAAQKEYFQPCTCASLPIFEATKV